MNNLTDKQLEELAKEKQREYQREWRKKNPDKVKEYNQRYWRKKALEMLKENKGDNQGLDAAIHDFINHPSIRK